MTIRFRQFNGQWYIRANMLQTPGTTVQVQRLDGSMSPVIVGEQRLPTNDGWYYYLFSRPQEQASVQASANVGDLARIITMFNAAAAHMRRPAIVLRIGRTDVRIYPAGERARVPGSINVVEHRSRAWLGRILQDGTWQPARNYYGTTNLLTLTSTLQEFARDPHTVAAEHGRVTGHCCFCNRSLTDERSTSVGYGPICADHYGLPWGGHAGRTDTAVAERARAAAREANERDAAQHMRRPAIVLQQYRPRTSLERLADAAYQRTHQATPPTDMTEEQWQQYKREYQERETAEERRR